MRSILNFATLAFLLFGTVSYSVAQENMLEDFENKPETRWRFFADTVMGGVSSGQMMFKTDGGASYAKMTGRVSTANNGGFIQIRMDLPNAIPEGAKGLRLVVRGNNQKYFVHLRTNGTVLPWQYYQASFDVSSDWTEVRLPLGNFKASGRMLRSAPRAQSLKSVGIVAFGREHNAEIDVRAIGFY